MTIISATQMAALQASARERTCGRLGAHVAQHFPQGARLAGADGVQGLARRCLQEADELRLDSDADLLRLQSLQLFFGHAFRADVLCRPFAAILAREDVTTPRVRIARAWQDGMQHFGRIAGDCGQHQRAAIARLAGATLRALHADPAGIDALRAGELVAWLWPVRHAVVQSLGADAFPDSLWQVVAVARRHGLARPGAVRVLLALAWTFGIGFDADPMLPGFAGLARALGDPAAAAGALAQADDFLARVAAAAPQPAELPS